MITILDEWCIVDKWWERVPDRTWYVEVLWNGRDIVFKKTKVDTVWRIVRPN